MIDTLISAFVMALVIGVLFWAVECLIDAIPLDNVFRKITRVIIVLIVLLVAYNKVVFPVLNVMGIHVPRIMN